MWPLRTIFYFATFWVACALSLVNPIWGVANYLLVYQMDPVGTWWGKPIAEIGVRYSLFAVAFTIIGVFISGRRVPTPKPVFSLWEGGIILLVLIGAANLYFGVDTGPQLLYTQQAFEKFWKMHIFVFLMVRLVTTRANLRIFIWSIVGGSLFLGYDAYTATPSAFSFGRLEYIGGADFATTSGFAAHMSGMLPIIGVGFLIARNWKWRLFALTAGALSVNAIIMCRTRSAFVGLLLGGLTAFLFAPRARRFRIHLLLIIAGTIGFTLTDAGYWERMATLRTPGALQADAAAETRFAIWTTSLEVLVDYPGGIGIGNFPRIIGQYDPRLHKRTSHNTVVVAFVELGVLGGCLFLMLAVGSIWYLFKCAELAPLTGMSMETRFTAYGLIVSVVTYFITGLGTERFLSESFWWVMALPLCLYRVVLRECAENRAVMPEGVPPEPAEIPVWSTGVQGAY